MAVKPKPEPCGAKKRQGSGRCTQRAGWGTNHPGVGKCKLHGGSAPIKHGRYSQIQREGLRKLIEQYEADPEPLNIFPELFATRALFQDFIDRYDKWRDALLAWHASLGGSLRDAAEAFREALATHDVAAVNAATMNLLSAINNTESSRPTNILDISNAARLLNDATRIVERVERIRAADHISRPDFARMMGEMGRVVDRYVEAPEILDKIKDGWLAIRL